MASFQLVPSQNLFKLGPSDSILLVFLGFCAAFWYDSLASSRQISRNPEKTVIFPILDGFRTPCPGHGFKKNPCPAGKPT